MGIALGFEPRVDFGFEGVRFQAPLRKSVRISIP